MRYLFRGLIRESGKTVEGAVEAETPEDALNALSGNGIVTEDLTPAPIPIGGARLAAIPRTAGRAGAPPLPPGELGAAANGHAVPSDYVPAEPTAVHPGSASSDPIDRAFAAASQSVSFDAVAQRYKGKSVWVIDRDKIRRQVAGVVDQALRQAQDDAKAVVGEAGEAGGAEAGDRIRESVADALKELFKDNRNIASQQTPEQAQAAQAQQQPAPVAAATANVTSPQLESLVERMEKFLGKADTVLTQLQVAARRVGTGGGGGGGAAGFGPRRMSHIPKPRNDEQNEVLLEIFKSNVRLRDNLNKKLDATAEEPAQTPADSPAEEPATEAAPA